MSELNGIELTSPVEISARLMPAVRIGDSWVSAEPTDRCEHNGKPIWRYAIDTPDWEHEGDDLAGWGDARDMLESLLGFLGAAAEAYGHPDSEHADLFPPNVTEWAYQNSDEISIVGCELEPDEDVTTGASAPRNEEIS